MSFFCLAVCRISINRRKEEKRRKKNMRFMLNDFRAPAWLRIWLRCMRLLLLPFQFHFALFLKFVFNFSPPVPPFHFNEWTGNSRKKCFFFYLSPSAVRCTMTHWIRKKKKRQVHGAGEFMWLTAAVATERKVELQNKNGARNCVLI